jgi:hypothetical protein
MKIGNQGMEGQDFLTITDEDGRSFIIPQGGSDVPPVEGGNEEAQSSGQEQSGGDPSGQDLIAPYLESVDEGVRDTVGEVLNRFRSDQDANVNRALEQRAQELQALQQESEIPMTIYQNLMTDPVGTLEWLTERLQEEMEVDARSQLLERWQQGQQQQTQQQNQQTQETGDKQLTAEDIQKILDEREQQQRQQPRPAIPRQNGSDGRCQQRCHDQQNAQIFMDHSDSSCA